MRSLLLSSLLLLSILSSFSQNVGIGNPSPAEKLDVIGNINLTGTIKTNGVDGEPNQVLMKNSAGNLAWGNMCEFKNRATLLTNQTWNVPAGVTRIAVEAWGAGGGGSYYGGGGGGGHLLAVFNVTPGDAINVVVGLGGSSGTTLATGGQTTTVTVGSVTLQALGGSSSTARGIGGSYAVSAGFFNYFGVNGQHGEMSRVEYFQRSSTNYIEVFSGGLGGNSGNAENTGGIGSYRILELGGSIIRNSNGSAGKLPGGGGGSGFSMLSGALTLQGYSGANGMVSILY